MVLLFTERKTTAPLFKSLSKTFKDKLVFGEVKKDVELQNKFGIKEIPTLLVISDPFTHQGETYNMSELKIDQLHKFLSTHAYSKPTFEKKLELAHLNYKVASNPTSGLCGKKTSNLCVILFLNGKG